MSEQLLMGVTDILNQLNHCHGHFPTEAVNAALAQPAIMTPYLLDCLKNTLAHYQAVEPDQMDYIFALYLLAKFREPQAFPLILAFALLPNEWPEELLGDCITEALARFMVSTYNGDLPALKALIENPEANVWSRIAALRSLLGLMALQHITREDVIDYCRSLFQSPLADNKPFTTLLVNVAADLYPEELLTEIEQAFQHDKVDLRSIDLAWIKQVLAKGKTACLADRVYNNSFHLPIETVEKDMSWMRIFDSAQEQTDLSNWQWLPSGENDFPLDLAVTYQRSDPKVGRNDPCPCGSGKKYKKCCLQ